MYLCVDCHLSDTPLLFSWFHTLGRMTAWLAIPIKDSSVLPLSSILLVHLAPSHFQLIAAPILGITTVIHPSHGLH